MQIHSSSASTVKPQTGASRGRRPDAQWSRTAILDAAYSLFTQRGFNATTIADIAEMAGVGKGLVTFHYKSKEDLLREAIARVIPELLINIEPIELAATDSAAALLRRTLRRIYRNLVEQPYAGAILRLLMSEGRRHPGLTAFYQAEVVAKGSEVLMTIIELGRARGEFRVDASDHLAHVILGPVIHTLFSRMLFGNIDEAEIEILWETHADMAIRGLLADPTPSPSTP